MNEKLLIETISKLHEEITEANKQLFQGIFLVLFLLVLAFTSYHWSGKPVFRELMMVLTLSGIWWIVRQELIIHSPGEWIAKAEKNVADIVAGNKPTHNLTGWETDRKKFWFRPIILTISDVLAASLIWYLLVRLRWNYPIGQELISGICKYLSIAGVPAICATIKLAGK